MVFYDRVSFFRLLCFRVFFVCMYIFLRFFTYRQPDTWSASQLRLTRHQKLTKKRPRGESWYS